MHKDKNIQIYKPYIPPTPRPNLQKDQVFQKQKREKKHANSSMSLCQLARSHTSVKVIVDCDVLFDVNNECSALSEPEDVVVVLNMFFLGS